MANRSPNLASPGLRLRSPNSASNSKIAISRGDSIDYGMSNTKARAYNNEQEVFALVFSKRKLLGAALSFIVYTAVVVVAVVFATKSDGTSTPNMTSKASSSSLSSSIENSGGFSSSNQVDTQATVNNNNNIDTTANINIVAKTTNDLPVSAYYGGTTSKYSRSSSKTGKKAGTDSKSSKATEPVCGLDKNLTACVPRISYLGLPGTRAAVRLSLCLTSNIPDWESEVVAYHNNTEDFTVKKVTFPENGDDYEKALYGGTGNIYSKRYPAGLVYATNVEEVKTALKCATDNGYNVSPRARGHHYQGMSNMDGHVVIDISLTCKVEEFEIVDPLEEGWLLPGQKWLKSIKSSAGCTNGVMIGYIAKHEEDFPRSEGALYQVGNCPSVGLAGYVTGGGSGLVTPYTGWGSDDLVEVDCLLSDGSVVTANKQNEYSDLFWAIRGGGSGFCIILNLTRAVIQSPEPKEGTDRKFVYTELDYFTEDDEQEDKRWLTSFQDFLYENPKSSKFGGGGSLTFVPKGTSGSTSDLFIRIFQGIFLGSYEEFIHVFGDAGLLDTLGLNFGPGAPTPISSYVIRFPETEPIPLPSQINPLGTRLIEFDKYTDSVVYNLCNFMVSDNTLAIAFAYVSWSQSGNWCADLDITPSKCEQRSFKVGGTDVFITWLKDPRLLEVNPCYDKEVIQKFEDQLSDPTSFMNRGGQVNIDRVLAEVFKGPTYSFQGTFTGAIMIPKLEVDVLNKIVKDTEGFGINHLQHGAATVPKPDDTANALRDTAIMTPVTLPVDKFNSIADTLVNEHKPYKGKPSALQGYVNYPVPIGNPNMKKFYYSDNVKRLSKIKRKYDPRNVFLQPLQIPAAPDKE